MLDINELMEYGRIGDVPEVYLQTMVQAASSVFLNKGIKEELLTSDEKATMNLGMMMLVTHWYENRIVVSKNGDNAPLAYGVDTIIFDLKLKCAKRSGTL
jgi:hypothetical protein